MQFKTLWYLFIEITSEMLPIHFELSDDAYELRVDGDFNRAQTS